MFVTYRKYPVKHTVLCCCFWCFVFLVFSSFCFFICFLFFAMQQLHEIWSIVHSLYGAHYVQNTEFKILANRIAELNKIFTLAFVTVLASGEKKHTRNCVWISMKNEKCTFLHTILGAFISPELVARTMCPASESLFRLFSTVIPSLPKVTICES